MLNVLSKDMKLTTLALGAIAVTILSGWSHWGHVSIIYKWVLRFCWRGDSLGE